jgi:hypothetical protein
MKHNIYTTLAGVLLVCFFASCKKEYSCVCGEGVGAVSHSLHNTRSKAKADCKEMESVFFTKCRLR